MRNLMWRYAAGVFALLLVVYYLAPTGIGQSIVYTGIGVASVVCVLTGVWLHRPAQVRAWLALAGATVCLVGGDAVFEFTADVLHRTTPFPSWADGLYLLGYPFLVVGAAGLLRGRRLRREDYVDAAIVSCGALAVLWQLLMHSYVHDGSLSAAGRLVLMTYPIMDIAIFFFVVGAVLAGRLRRPSLVLLGLGLAAVLSADTVYDLLLLHGKYSLGGPTDAGWLIGYALFGVAALHPSMSAISNRAGVSADAARSSQLNNARGRLPLVAPAGFITPIILIVASVIDTQLDLAVLGGVSIVLFGLVILRASWLFQRLYHQTVQLRAQSEELGAALNTQLALEGDLHHQAFHDGLTGLANRALLRDRIDHALLSAPRSNGGVALLICDLDDFKTINDGGGQQVGDELLRLVAGRLESVVRPGDTVARIGGDEFAILLDAVEHPDVATITADRMVAVLRQPIELAGQRVRLTVSVGVSIAQSRSTPEDLIGEADSALSAAKAAGKDQVRCFEHQMREGVVRRLELRNSFESALARGEFSVVYQPYFSLAEGNLRGFEALVRWQHPDFGLISPAEFIPLAEETGFIVPLGQWVLDTACTFAVDLSHYGYRGLGMSVNVSIRQLRGNLFIEGLRTTLAYSGFDPARLTLEITESVLTHDPCATAQTLAELKQLGARIAIDDFGTGYSSLSYLSRFPIDILKIDKSFVDPLGDPARQGIAFVSTIIGLAKQLGLATVAEGIETDSQYNVLADLGCELGQGYLMARPMSADEALTLAEQDHASQNLVHRTGT